MSAICEGQEEVGEVNRIDTLYSSSLKREYELINY